MSELKNGCAKIRPLLEPYFEGMLSEVEERKVAEHLWQCQRCAAEVEQIRRLTVVLSQVPVAEPDRALLAAIAARVAAAPDAAELRVARGWRRLGWTEAGVLAGVAAVWYLLALFGPHLLSLASPLFLSVRGEAVRLGEWAVVHYQALAGWGSAALHAAPSAGQSLLRAAPRGALYVGLELALVAMTAFGMQLRRRPAHQPVSTRRS